MIGIIINGYIYINAEDSLSSKNENRRCLALSAKNTRQPTTNSGRGGGGVCAGSLQTADATKY